MLQASPDASVAGYSDSLVTALIAAGAAIATTVFTNIISARVATRALKREQAETLERYRKPLMRAAQDVQSRLYNILCKDFLAAYLGGTDDEDQQYAAESTLFVIAQFFAWNEIMRRDVQFADLETEKTGPLSAKLNQVTRAWASDEHGRMFQIFSAQQRAIGERMIRVTGVRSDCMGYADFCDEVSAGRIPHLMKIRKELWLALADLEPRRHRLRKIQHALIDLLNILDPACTRLPAGDRFRAGEGP